jgi:hypothetical protein
VLRKTVIDVQFRQGVRKCDYHNLQKISKLDHADWANRCGACLSGMKVKTFAGM